MMTINKASLNVLRLITVLVISFSVSAVANKMLEGRVVGVQAHQDQNKFKYLISGANYKYNCSGRMWNQSLYRLILIL